MQACRTKKSPGRTRKHAEERRKEIARAALQLLNELPVAELSTRSVARRVGVTQPALFKHFRSRESILLAVLALVRAELQGLVHSELARALPPRAALESLLGAFGDFVAGRPGVPRLLFHELAHRESGERGGSLIAPLRHLASMQRALFGELVRGAQRSGELPPSLDPDAAAAQMLALVRGQILASQFGESDSSLRELFHEALLGAWAAWERGVPATSAESVPEHTAPLQPLLKLDVRPLIERGEDPLEEILALLELLAPNGAVQLVAPFRPSPLITLLTSRGLDVSASERGQADWEILLRGEDAAPLLDLRDLAAPEPMERVLLARGSRAKGQALLARLPRRPELLLQRLSELGELWNVLELDDGSCLLHLTGKDS